MELLEAYIQDPSTVLRNRIIEQHRGLVKSIARSLCRNGWMDVEDLEMVGYDGLIYAIERLGLIPTHAFLPYARVCIKGKMREFLGQNGAVKLPSEIKQLRRRMYAAEAELFSLLGRQPTHEEVRLMMGISVEKFLELQQANCSAVSLDAPVQQGEEGFTLLHTIPCPDNEGTEAVMVPERLSLFSKLRSILDFLPQELQQIVEWAYVDNRSPHEIARFLERSTWDVEQYLDQALSLLRQQFEDPGSATELPEWQRATQSEMQVVLEQVQTAIVQLQTQRSTVHIGAIAQTTGIECQKLWHHPKALHQIQFGEDVPSRVRAAIQRLAQKRKRATLAAVAREAKIPMMIARRYRHLLPGSRKTV
jgi:RNA polymerase sigma-B factor